VHGIVFQIIENIALSDTIIFIGTFDDVFDEVGSEFEDVFVVFDPLRESDGEREVVERFAAFEFVEGSVEAFRPETQSALDRARPVVESFYRHRVYFFERRVHFLVRVLLHHESLRFPEIRFERVVETRNVGKFWKLSCCF
jgi:hypothetical protein